MLTTVEGETSNYPVAGQDDGVRRTTRTASWRWRAAETTYSATATLLSMRQFPDAYSGGNVTIQTWQITGVGTIDGAGAAAVQVSAIIETQAVPAFRYAAFATNEQLRGAVCSAAAVRPTATTRKAALVGGKPVDIANYGGDVGTNGGLTRTVVRRTDRQRHLSTPRAASAPAPPNNVTALDVAAGRASEGLVKLPQAVKMKTPGRDRPGAAARRHRPQEDGRMPRGRAVLRRQRRRRHVHADDSADRRCRSATSRSARRPWST